MQIEPEADSHIFRDFEPELWMRCETQERIAEQVGVPQRTVADWIASFSENGSEDDSAIFRDFEPELYTVWNFGKATKRARAALRMSSVQLKSSSKPPRARAARVQVSDFGHVIGKPHARELHFCQTFGRSKANPMSAGCNSSVVEMLPPPKTGKPHERESYSLQNTVAVTIPQ